MSTILGPGGRVVIDGVDAHTGDRARRRPRPIADAVAVLAEPVLREVGLREVARRMDLHPGGISAHIASGASTDWWCDALAVCGYGVTIDATGASPVVALVKAG